MLNSSLPSFGSRAATAFAVLAGFVASTSSAAAADGTAPSTINSGDTAWMLVATALVLFMMIPGLSLFYAGLVRSKNVLSILTQCFGL
ncbi:MAG: amtY, partial [Verrucomicrobiaceae bacterium]|nr:amtY [Verrucomicrobiaceae bacterium]